MSPFRSRRALKQISGFRPANSLVHQWPGTASKELPTCPIYLH